jgi:hypothetical protein
VLFRSVDINDNEYLIKLVKLFTNIDDEDIDEMTIEDFNKLILNLEFLLKEPKIKVKQKVRINNKTYMLADNFNQIKLGEMITIKTYQEKMGQNAIPYILAILLREPTKNSKGKQIQSKFDASTVQQRVDEFMIAPITEFLGVLNFFLTGTKASQQLTKDSSIVEQNQTH